MRGQIQRRIRCIDLHRGNAGARLRQRVTGIGALSAAMLRRSGVAVSLRSPSLNTDARSVEDSVSAENSIRSCIVFFVLSIRLQETRVATRLGDARFAVHDESVRLWSPFGFCTGAVPMRGNLHEQALDLVQPLYSTVFAEDGWSLFLKRLQAVMECDVAIAVVLDRQGRPSEFMIEGGFSDAMAREYEHHFAAIDPWANNFIASQQPMGKVVLSQELLSDREFEQTEYYNDFWRPNDDLFHTCGTLIEVDEHTLANVGLPRRRSRGGYDPADIALLDVLSPHIRAALQLRGRFREARDAAAAAMAGLDAMSDAVMILDARGRIVHANLAAGAELTSGLHVTCRHGYVSAGKNVVAEDFQSAFKKSAALAKGNALNAATVLSSQELDPAQRASISFYPLTLQDGQPSFELSGPHVLLIVCFQQGPADANAPLLRMLYRLTPAEVRVAMGLARGLGVEEIASSLGVGVGTVRIHLKHVFLKTGTRRQGQLVSLLNRVLPRMR